MHIADPDPDWPAHFDAEAARLRPAFGPDLRALEHVGSTAVPGLAAKPILDIMAAVDALAQAEARLPALRALGYRSVPTTMPERLLLQRDAAPAANLHVITAASWPSRKERLFRDRLRAHPEEAAAYGALKRELIRRFGSDVEAYTRAKTALIQEIMDRAADEVGRPRQEVWE
jgi:GrpB-like predicted nucleotidyltransferase (UPF0157 family)